MNHFYTITEGVNHYIMATSGDETIDDIILAIISMSEGSEDRAVHLVGKLNDAMADYEAGQ